MGTLLQSVVGAAVGQAAAPPAVHAVVAEWTTTDRLSVWARGQLALTDPSRRLYSSLRDARRTTAAQIAAAPPLPAPTPGACAGRPPLPAAA